MTFDMHLGCRRVIRGAAQRLLRSCHGCLEGCLCICQRLSSICPCSCRFANITAEI